MAAEHDLDMGWDRPANAPAAQDMTTDLTHPGNVSVLSEKVNTTGPTREEIANVIDATAVTYGEHRLDQSYLDNPDEIADAIIALYAPALARLEKERDEARAVEDQAVGRLQDVLSEAEAALATAEAEGMRKAAGIAGTYAKKSDGKFTGVIKRSRVGERNLELAAATAAGMEHAGRNIVAAILAAIPKGK